MKTTVSSYDFVNAFDRCGRSTQFSRAGRFALFEYLEDMENETGTEIEMDVIALCCDFSEYSSAVDAAKEYSDWEADAEATDEENEASALEYLRDNTQVIEYDGGIIIQCF